MADVRKIVIEVIGKDEEHATGETKKDTKKKDTQQLGKSVILNQAYSLAKDTIERSVVNTFNRYTSLREDYLAENAYNNIMTTIGKVSNMATAIVGGAIVGGVAGAIIGGVGFAVTEVMGYNQRMSNYYQSLNATNIQTAFSRTRAGLINDGKGTEN